MVCAKFAPRILPALIIGAQVEEKPQKMQKKQPNFLRNGLFSGTPEGTRTPDLLVRSQSLYPTELPAHTTLSALQ